MKLLLSIASCLILCVSCSTDSQTESLYSNSDWKKLKLKGKVKAIKEIKFLAVTNFSEIVNGEIKKYIYNKEFLFNLDGLSIEQNDYIPDGTLANRIMYLYQGGKLIEYNEYDSQGLLYGTGKFEIDDKGNPIYLHYKTTDGRYNWHKKFEYNSSNQLIEAIQFSTEEAIDSKETYTYRRGNLESSAVFKEEKKINNCNYKYDEEGAKIEMQYNEDLYTYNYNYDSKGNWTKKVVFKNNNPSGILIREIEYFN